MTSHTGWTKRKKKKKKKKNKKKKKREKEETAAVVTLHLSRVCQTMAANSVFVMVFFVSAKVTIRVILLPRILSLDVKILQYMWVLVFRRLTAMINCA